MSFINWGEESREQKDLRSFFEQQALYEQAMRMRLQAQGGVGGGSRIQTSEWIDLALSKLNAKYSEITALVPNIYLFWDDYTTSGETGDPLPGINDGGDDMYDGGNYLNTNLTNLYDIIKEGGIDEDNPLAATSIPYTHTQADNEDDENEYTSPPMDGIVSDGNSYFGPGSKYFTNMYPGLFVMVADNTSVSEFSITGNVGSDEDTVNGGSIEEVIPGWTLFYKTNLEDPLDTDPTINHLILIPGSSDGITHEFEDDDGGDSNDNDDHAVIGISDRSRIVYALVSTQPGEPVLTSDQFISVAEKILEIIL
jgi:hypothetical protein